MIGPSRDKMEIAHVNDSSRPTIIDSDYFVGRVLIKIRDFEGITPDNSPPIRDHVYFDGRSRKFDIQIEGRFKRRHGVELYTGEEIHFGSDFDHIVDFPKSAFNAGMRVARWIDPNVFYDLTPPSERPFIMSPYLACMNTLCAWPCPDRLRDALVCLRQSDRDDDHNLISEGDDMVPMEQVDPSEIGATAGKKKIGRHPRRYWRFIGLKGNHSRIDAFLVKNHHLLAEPPVDHHHQSENHHQKIESGVNHNEDDEYDDGDASSCRAPSSHATYCTAIENYSEIRPSVNSASSYRFSPRIFPRHQVSLGAGMRDLYQDAEIEANEREGEARAQRMVELMGEDDTMPSQRLSPVHEAAHHPKCHPNGGHESDEGHKKGGGSKVKHSLKKLKTALKKMTPNLSSASTPTSSPLSSASTKRKLYSTNLHGKNRLDHSLTPCQATVSRAASRRLPHPIPRDSSQTLRDQSRSSAEVVKTLARSSSLMPRPQSHYASSRIPSELQHQHSKIRSTSLDHTRPNDLNAPINSLKLQTTQSSLSTIQQSATDFTEPLSPQQGSSRLLSGTRNHRENSVRLSSPSTSRTNSNQSSDTSRSPGHTEKIAGNVGETFKSAPESCESPSSMVGAELAQEQIRGKLAGQSRSSTSVNSDFESSAGTGSNTNSYTPLATSHSSLPPSSSSPKMDLENDGREDRLAKTQAIDAGSDSISLSKTHTQISTTPSQAEIAEAPELEDVEVGDLMFANMLNLAGESSGKRDPVQHQLGPWRFKNPTTDILEDNTFVFLNQSVNVQKRRKHFSESNGKHRKAFTYDPDVVYATSFFSPFMDFNTFDLAIGPVKINVAKVFGDMPVRYTLRSTRIDRNHVGDDVKPEEEIFVTISFELVDA